MTLCVRCGRPALELTFRHWTKTLRDTQYVGLCYEHARYALWDDITEALAEKEETHEE